MQATTATREVDMFLPDRRWTKVINDLWLYKARTIVVITAVALGVTGIGLVSTTLTVLVENYVMQYWAANPAQARLNLSPFGESTLRQVQHLPEVMAADARHVINAQIELAGKNPYPLMLQAIPNFESMTVDTLKFMPGAQVPPPKGSLLLERSVLNNQDVRQGDTVRVRMPDGKQHQLTVAGFVFDSVQIPTPISSQLYGYITFETAFWLEQDEKGVFTPILNQRYDRLLVVTQAGTYDKAGIEAQVYRLKEDLARFTPSAPTVLGYTIPPPGKPTLQDNLNSMRIVLEVAGVTSLALSGFLVVNIMTALIAQQMKQIGILKAIGGRAHQIVELYLVMAMFLGGVAFVMAVPLGLLGAYGVTRFIARIVNIDVLRFYLPWSTLGLQAAASLLVPLAATFIPAWRGTRITARESMASNGASPTFRGGLLGRLGGPFGAGNTPILLSVRNVFRQKLRLVLTLVALSIGGSTFIAVIGTHASLNAAFDTIKAENNYDIQIRYQLDKDTLPGEVEKAIRAVPGVVAVETWKTASIRRVFDDGTQSGSVPIIGIPPETPMLHPNPLAGRWLAPDGRDTLYVNFDALEVLGTDALDRPIQIEINGDKEWWQVVGVGSRTLNPVGYIRLEDFERLYKIFPPQRLVIIQTQWTDRQYVEGIEAQIMERFAAKKWKVDSSITLSRNIGSAFSQINNVIYILLGTAALIAAVGGLGLANTLELSVMERTREIGVLRSLGARNHVIRQMVITESITICLISSVIAAVLSNPIGRLLCDLIGNALLARKLTYEFSSVGLLLWMILISTLSLLASLAPAQSAIKLTVRDTLAYE